MGRDLQRLQERHLEIVERLLSGQRVCDIAWQLELTENSVRRIVASPKFQDVLAQRRRERQVLADGSIVDAQLRAREALAGASVKAVETLRGLLDSGAESTKLKSASEILEHAFQLDPVARPGATSVSFAPTQVNIQVLREALAESRSLPVIEADAAPAPAPALAPPEAPPDA